MAILVYFVFLFVISSATACDRCVHQTKATHTSLSYGACGYGPLAAEFNEGLIASAPPSLYKNGAGCGACFEVRCKDKALCRSEGTKVTVTDRNGESRTDFVLSTQAFEAMAKEGSEEQLLNLGIVDIEYKRVPCEYQNQNLELKIEEYSSKPYYVAIKVLSQGGQTEISAIDVAAVGSRQWQSLSRNYGAVWNANNVPAAALKFRFAVTADYSTKWVYSQLVIPAEWQPGLVYDTGVQITDIAQEICSPCDYGVWK